jgi:hypothetical protein
MPGSGAAGVEGVVEVGGIVLGRVLGIGVIPSVGVGRGLVPGVGVSGMRAVIMKRGERPRA